MEGRFGVPWYKGTIEEVGGGQRFAVIYDDGDVDTDQTWSDTVDRNLAFLSVLSAAARGGSPFLSSG